MAALMDTRILLRKIKDLRSLTPRRNRVKTKWAGSLPKYPATNLALQNFDATYKLQLGEQWPSVRVSLLCEQKYGALSNNFSDNEGVIAHLQSQGCRDIVSCALDVGTRGMAASSHDKPTSIESITVSPDMPTVSLSPNIKCLVFPRRDVSRFKPSRPDAHGLLGYYLMDAASILPVLALDVQEGQSVLDLCAAPGGKALVLLQTQAIRFLHLNDISWGETERDTFDRVLVDVPCTTDRHSVKEEENNIFSRVRTKEKQKLPQLQLELLLAGIKAVRPGGLVVYSTCSLSQLQNEYVTERAVHLAREELGISLQVADLRPLTQLFQDTFNFAPDPYLGQLVLPHLTANFGPIYMCKLQRLN
ncbi:hypothetical protein UPYG_G00298350 [Umbra pygmaea]|uniref:5-cytosine rRNA methyltransferase NSUN4 n=1 Tax=Umbra pygmaea TaxID=75934 RepID=A0ABD0WPI5_UMBPY